YHRLAVIDPGDHRLRKLLSYFHGRISVAAADVENRLTPLYVVDHAKDAVDLEGAVVVIRCRGQIGSAVSQRLIIPECLRLVFHGHASCSRNSATVIRRALSLLLPGPIDSCLFSHSGSPRTSILAPMASARSLRR